MLTPDRTASPREFGAALRAARERSGVSLEALVERTKIARRVLEALEAGDFAKLPNRVFMRLFLQQYLSLIGEAPESWMNAFAATWQRFEEASEPWQLTAPTPARSHRWLPWIVGTAVVVCGLLAVVLVERRGNGKAVGRALPTPEVAAPIPEVLAPTPAPAPPPEPTVPAVPAGVLVLRALTRPCWVEVHVDGEVGSSRLLSAGEEWLIEAGGRHVSLVVGDAGSLAVSYLGEARSPVGSDGDVLRLELPLPPATPRAS